MTKIHQRLIALEGAHNVRDLGGYMAASGATTCWRSLLRADGLHMLSGADVDNLLAEGVATVIDLRGSLEIDREINPFGVDRRVQYHNIPLFSALAPIAGMTGTDGEAFDMAERYRNAIDRCQPAIAAVMSAIADAPEGAVLFHCSAGKDRTGIISAILLAIAGVEDEAIVEDYALTATVARPLIERLREKAIRGGTNPVFVDRFLACEPETMRSTLLHVKGTYGHFPAYLKRIGLSEADIRNLRRRMLG
jgi:protein-tyrosine phosphatase